MHIAAYADAEPCDQRLTDLYDALSALRSRAACSGAVEERHWRVVERYVRETSPWILGEDFRQEVLLTIFLTVHRMRALRPRAAAAWIRAIRNTKAIDAKRVGGVRLLSMEGRLPPLALAAAAAPGLDVVEAILRAFEAEVRHDLASEMNPVRRDRRLLQARAALRRLVLDEPLGVIATQLDVDAPPMLLAKWIERGRADVLATIVRLRRDAPDAADQYLLLEELARTRRSDAGRPRPNRRRRCAELS